MHNIPCLKLTAANGKADLQISSLNGGFVDINDFALRSAEPHRSDSTTQMFRYALIARMLHVSVV